MNFLHFGLAVDNIEVSSSLFRRVFGFSFVNKREITHSYIYDLVAEEGVSAKVELLKSSDGVHLELLEWTSSSRVPLYKNEERKSITKVGAKHICVMTQNIEQTYSLLKMEEGVEFISNGIVEIKAGPNLGALVFFVRLWDNLMVEIFQKPKSISDTIF